MDACNSRDLKKEEARAGGTGQKSDVGGGGGVRPSLFLGHPLLPEEGQKKKSLLLRSAGSSLSKYSCDDMQKQ